MIEYGVQKVVIKPWGSETWIALCDKFAFKKIEIKKGFVTSLQFHKYKRESMYILSGEALLHVEDGSSTVLKAGDAVYIEPKDVHRLEALEDIVLFEASSPEVWDVVRLKDSYGRENTNEP